MSTCCAPKTRSFSRFVRNYVLLGLVITLVLYTVVVNFYMLYGKWMVASFQLQVIAEQYDNELAENREAPLPKGFNIETFTGFDQLPAELRAHATPDDLEIGELFYINTDKYAAEENPENPVFLVFPYQLRNGDDILILQTYHAGDEDSIYFVRLHKLALLSIPFAMAVVGIFAWFLWVIGKRLTKPSENLQNWANNLTADNLREPIPDFGFEELNDVAHELHRSVDQIDKFVAREREFLRQASHELRTPVTIVSGNVELLEKSPLNATQARVMARIKRANRNMQQLLETLLWLGRDNAPLGQTETINISSFIEQEISDLSYLMGGKHVTCTFEPDSRETEIATSRAALMIVVSNLIRNAFQHTPKGEVKITLSGTQICVENAILTCNGQCTMPQGEGIGLQLVRRICERLDWTCTLTHLPNGGMSVCLDPGAETRVERKPELVEN
ncbi:sensor histidine kinase [Thalassospira tepidiphila]|uniref:histidine kinase n=2 Tax=Thalassospira tepidiphila TaxID=393657 RepID=A0A853KYA4_9PROT|nr:HAMP domain-containing sensor histidine kinase [Thalassospira tepidiphila]NJB76319.1 signal transduction histidine kinase [Thalassospira tepidiphila]OAZ09658.1 histidine kinase [Thalassospira tepidiphila MCCC 1A03514]